MIEQGAAELTIVSNNAGNGDTGLAAVLAAGRVAKVICSFPRQADSYVFDELYRAGKVDLEVVPQGNLAERIRQRGGPESAHSSVRPGGSALRSPTARKSAPSKAAITYWSTRSAATSHS